jgi:membrane-bound lytic murein transglycosylase D
MWTRTHLLVLSTAVGLLPGCAAFQMTSGRSAPLIIATTQELEPSASSETKSSMEAPLQAIDSQEEHLPVPVMLDTSSQIDKETARSTPDKQETKAKPATAHTKPPVVKNAPHLGAGDRLLELLQKDIDKAVEQPVERRHLQFSKAVIENARVRHFINYFSKTGKESFAKMLARSGRYMPMIAKILREEGLPEEFAYLALIESGFSPEASSPNGAAGLWQFIATTARKYGLRIDSWVDERRDPVKSTHAAAAHLKELHQYFGKWYLATAAYNAGQGAIDRALQTPGAKNLWGLSTKAQISDETRDFVPKFVAVSLLATHPGKYGLPDVPREEPLDYDEVEVRGSMRLEALAGMAETNLETIQELNPALRRNVTPPDANFPVKLPIGKALVFAKAYDHFLEKEAASVQVVTHEVKKGETLSSIARRYGQQVRSLMELNGLSSPRLRIGQQLKVIIEGLRGGLR